MLPVWAVLGHNVLYIGVGFLWLSFAGDGVPDEEVVTREKNKRTATNWRRCSASRYSRTMC